ncbi:MAG: DUF1559 domain-containing protein [Fuerstiella sp.]
MPQHLTTSPPHHSWRIALLPWLGEQELFQQYDQSTAWDSSVNQRLLTARPSFYACPKTVNPELTSYQVPVSIRSAWPYDMQLQMRDFTDGASNTVLMIDSHSPEVKWTAPQDLNMNQASAAIKDGQQHSDSSHGQVTQVLLADGSVRLIANTIDGDLRRALLSPAGGRLPLQPLSAIAQKFSSLENQSSATKPFAAPRDSARWPGVVMWPTARKEIDPANSNVYCPTLTLAWRKFLDQTPHSIQTPLATELTQSPFTLKDIAKDSIVTETSKFSVRCKLKKHLSFVAKFDAFRQPLHFVDQAGDHQVKAFGVTSHWNDYMAALSQIRVHDYRSPDDFIITIANDAAEDLVLAKIPPTKPLSESIKEVVDRIRNSKLPLTNQRVVRSEQLVIPILEVSVKADFRQQLRSPTNPRLEEASQSIQFRLDERGATVWSEARIVGENGHYDLEVGKRTFVFDKAFLLMLREASDKQPYFATWIGNTEFMIPAE